MNLNFLKKLNKVEHVFQKPINEEGLNPNYVWRILLIIYFFIGVLILVLVFLSYNFLTKDREGVLDQNLNSTPQLNTQKIQNIEKFFDKREELRSAVYTKTIIDPSKK